MKPDCLSRSESSMVVLDRSGSRYTILKINRQSEWTIVRDSYGVCWLD